MALTDMQSKPPPKVAELALVLGVARSTIYEWKKSYPEFSDIIEEIQSAQEIMLIDNGLGGTYNPTIAKVLLTKHGYVDKQELTGEAGKDLIPSEISQMTNEQLEAVLEGRSKERAS